MSMPLIPRSTAKLKLGDYGSLRREDGRYVPLAFLGKVLNKRVVFYGGLLSLVSDSPVVQEDGPIIEIAEVALIDIDVFSASDAPIQGNLGARLSKEHVQARLAQVKTRSLVWGRNTPVKYANRLAV